MAFEISEYAAGTLRYGALDGQVPGAALAQQAIALSGVSQQSAGFNPATQVIAIYAGEAARFAIGSDPTATAASRLISAGQTIVVGVQRGWKIAAIAAAAGSGGAGATAAPPASATATAAQVAATATAGGATLLAANAARRGATIYYDGAAILYLLEGAGVPAANNFTIKLGQGYFTSYDAPPGWTGAIQGIWSAATGAAAVTERTA